MLVLILPTQSMGREVNLQECIKLASENNSEIARARAIFLVAKERERQSLANLLPSLDLSVARSKVEQERSDVGTGKINQNYMIERDAIVLRQPIYRPELLTDLKRSKVDVEAERFVLEEKENSLKYRVAQTFMRLLILTEDVALQKRKTQLLDEQLLAAKKSIQAGRGTVTEKVELQAAYDKAIVDILSAEQSVKIEFKELSFLTGEEISKIKKLNPEKNNFSKLRSIDLETWEGRAIENNIGIMQIIERIQALELALSMQKNAKLPKLDLNMEISRGSSESSFFVNTETSSKSIGLSLNFPLYRGGSLSSKIREASARLSAEKENLKFQEDDVRKQVQKAYFGLSENYRLKEALTTAVDSAKTELSSSMKSAKAGFRRNLDILVSQQKLLNVEKTLFDSKINMMLFWLNLNVLSGKFSDKEIRIVDDFFIN